MNYRCKTAKTVDELDVAAWQQVCNDPSDAPMDIRYLRAVERSAPEGATLQFLTFFDEEDRPVACACVSKFAFDGTLFVHNLLASIIRIIRKVCPWYLNFKVIMCGLPVSLAESNVRRLASANPERLANSLDEQLRRIAKENKAWLLVAKEFTDQECQWMDQMKECGYLRAASLPMNTFDHSFSSMDEFLQALRSHYRYKIKRSRKKFERSGIDVERITDPTKICDLYTPEVHSLYEAIAGKAEHRLEILPRDFFHELTRQLAPHIVFTVLRQGDKIVAFAWSMATGTIYRNMFVGIDADANEQSDAYFNLMLIDLDYALRQGATKVYMGQTADDFKSRLGCNSDPRTIYVRMVPRWLHWCVLRCETLIFPPFEQAERRDLFKPAEVEEAGVVS